MRVLLAAFAAVAITGCGASSSGTPKDDPKQAAVKVLNQIVHNHYTEAWDDLHPTDQAVAPRDEYVNCESRSPVIAVPLTVRALRVKDESIGLGDGTFVDSKAVALRLGFEGGFAVTHTVHLVASHGSWKWILPSWRFRDYKADRCPTDAGSSPPPSQS
ncbi:MAG TPA: hypothetical protein VIK66_01370 [Gaiellaceae bacterium]